MCLMLAKHCSHVFVAAAVGLVGEGEGWWGRHQEEALHMVCSDAVNVAQYGSI